MNVVVYLIEVSLLAFISRSITIRVFNVLLVITKSKRVSMWCLWLTFLPGTILHELSHLLFAALLFVPFGKLNFQPTLEDGGIKMGSVAIAQTDIFRRQLIGAAPFFLGNLILITGIIFLWKFGLYNNYLLLSLSVFIVFQISNTMFSSKKDLEGMWVLTVLALILALLLFAFNIISFSTLNDFLKYISDHEVSGLIVKIMFIPLAIDCLFIFVFSLMERGLVPRK